MTVLSDAQIQALVNEPKPLPPDWRMRLSPRPGRIGHKSRDFDLLGANGSAFRVVVRQNTNNPLDFSVILGYRPMSGPRLFRLRRYNGKSHRHKNRIEGDVFYDFHIHAATERYQLRGMDEDGYAQPTDRYSDLHGALARLVEDCAFVSGSDEQLSWLEAIQ